MKCLSMFVLFFSFFSATVSAKKIIPVTKEMKFNYASFDEAQKSNNFLKFVGKSTKFKIITTEFEGYAKTFSINYEQTEHGIKNISINLDTASLDTDSDGRNEKMWKKCLDVEKFPKVSAATKESIELVDSQTGEIDIDLLVKDKKLNRKLQYVVKKSDTATEVSFTSNFSFVEAGIEDPSIAIAKVDEIFQLSGKITF